jgi:hypothetical protein
MAAEPTVLIRRGRFGHQAILLVAYLGIVALTRGITEIASRSG